MVDEQGVMKAVTFGDLMRESVIVQGTIAVIAILGTFIMLMMGRDIEPQVWVLDGSIIGFFFGAKSSFNSREQISTFARLLAESAKPLQAQIAEMKRPSQ